MEIKLNIIMCLKKTTHNAEVIWPNLDILAMHFTSKTLAAETMDQHNHVVGFDTKGAFNSSVNEFNDRFPPKSLHALLAGLPRTSPPMDLMTTGISAGLSCILIDTNTAISSFELYYTQRQCLPCSIGRRIGITIYVKKVPYFACTGCAVMQPTYGATWRQDAKVPDWCTIKEKVIQACFDSPPHPSLHGNPDAQSRDRICKACFIKVRAIFADQSRGCKCVRCTGQSASVIVSEAADLS